MNIGLLSDTHGYLDPQILTHFAHCDEIWHAGDVGDLAVLDALRAAKPLRVVGGNIDTPHPDLPLNLRFEANGVNIWITHIGGTPPRYNPTVRPQILQNPPDLFICGHSHILKIMRDPTQPRVLYVNPGAAGKSGFHVVRTCVRFRLEAGRVGQMEVIELGKR
jgi:uncharacterized protein